jgi:DNA-binding CsgD family transcriptional regulator
MLTNTKTSFDDLVRNCCRCGGEFHMGEHERVCQACNKPRLDNGQLTLREKQVIALVTQAKLNKEIAYDLHLSEGTIKVYLSQVFRKLGVRNRLELALWSFGHQAECSLTPSRNQPEPVGLSDAVSPIAAALRLLRAGRRSRQSRPNNRNQSGNDRRTQP